MSAAPALGGPKSKFLKFLLFLTGVGIAATTVEVNAAEFHASGDLFEAKVNIDAILCPKDECAEIKEQKIPDTIPKNSVAKIPAGKYRVILNGSLDNRKSYFIIDIGQLDKSAIVIEGKDPRFQHAD
jgi:hypothetical protein